MNFLRAQSDAESCNYGTTHLPSLKGDKMFGTLILNENGYEFINWLRVSSSKQLYTELSSKVDPGLCELAPLRPKIARMWDHAT